MGMLKTQGQGTSGALPLSAPIKLNVEPAKISRDLLLAAMWDRILATAELRADYSRPATATLDQGDRNTTPEYQGVSRNGAPLAGKSNE